jgi:aspartyl-tRNA(Asn)/glutamyl-tRNA(Gln) amidotransferase subunit C
VLEPKELEKTVRLAKIGLTGAEIELFGSQLTKIVDYFANLKSLNLKDIEPTSHVIIINCPRRTDEKIKCPDDVLANMPWVKFGQFIVPIILDALAE